MKFMPYKKKSTPTVIIVALIDILIVLLIFMPVTTTLKHQDSTIKLALPESSHTSTSENRSVQSLLVEIHPEAPYLHLQGRPVTYEKLKDELNSGVSSNPDMVLWIKADKMAPWGEIVKVRDAAMDANVSTVKALTEKATPEA